MEAQAFLLNVGIALVTGLVGGMCARLLRLPVLIGYLAAGIVIGPYTPGIFAHTDAVRTVADLGVILLMFAVGVQFSLKELEAVRRTAVLGGGAQILGTLLLGVLVGRLLGWSWYGGLFLGCAIALSSTAVMMRILEERGELGTDHGRVMLGISVVQDLSLVLMAALLPALAVLPSAGANAFTGLGLALLRAGLFVGVTLLLAVRGVPALLRRVLRLGSRELFLLTVVALCLAAAISAEMAGLGPALGAFLAGMVVSESDYADEIFAQIRPLRDVFASLFFVSIGMLLDPRFLVGHWPAVLVVVLAIGVGKALITAAAVYTQGVHGRTAILTGLGMAQIGEFSFVLAGIGTAGGLIPAEIASVLLSAALVSLLLAPFLYQAGGPVYARLNAIPWSARLLNRQQTAAPPDLAPPCPDTRVLILGCGRIGRYVSRSLQSMEVSHMIIDYDADAIAWAKEAGVPTLYGDASSEVVLAHAAPDCKDLAIVTLPEDATTEMSIRVLRRLVPALPIVARVHRAQDIEHLHTLGVDAVVYAEFEASVEMIRRCLDRLGFPVERVHSYIGAVRQTRYASEPADLTA